ncbi:hypothetical protein OAK38_04810 [Verrucomicrobia bacterium]|nr:hypothetical protein [Verrucomicrobiota bacterium]
MKKLLAAMFVALLMVGCGESDLSDPDVVEDATADAVDWSKLQDRYGVTYLPNTDKPFSGYAKQVYENEQVEALAQFKDGYVVRLKQWQENGTPRWDAGLIEGKVGVVGMPLEDWRDSNSSHHDGPTTIWYENGQKMSEVNFKDGELDGLATGWYESGQKEQEVNWKDEKVMSAEVWKPDGEKCLETNVKDGNGVWVWYNEDGTESGRSPFKDGELVRD